MFLHVIPVHIVVFDNRQLRAELAHVFFYKCKLAQRLPPIDERWQFETEEHLKRLVS